MGTVKKMIDYDVQFFLAIIKESLYVNENVKCNVENNNDHVDWDYIYRAAIRNNVSSIIYPVVAKMQGRNGIPQDILKSWDVRAKKNYLNESKKYIAIRRIITEAEKEKIKLVFFKGCILADLYPQYMLRSSSDTDIFVLDKDRDAAIKVLERLGYIKNEEHSKEQVAVYGLQEMNHYIELHFLLWEDYQGKKIDILRKMGIDSEDSFIEIEACGIKLTTLGYDQHLIYQMFHIIKHFSIDGVGIRYLVDITLYINRYGESINFTFFWEQMKLLGFSEFCYSFFSLCIQYFDMKKDINQAIGVMNNSSEEALLMDIINKGLLYDNKTADWQILGIMTPYLVGDETISKSRLMRKMKVLFPSRKALPDKLNYAKRHGFLLPVAWIHKMVDFIIRYKKFNKINDDLYDAGQKLTVADHRLTLMKNLGLVEKKRR